jgi:hypothetical protein
MLCDTQPQHKVEREWDLATEDLTAGETRTCRRPW